ncbi:MAG: hypothetical protein H6999_11095 [Hahellaceae bacterium]|nr:hypothetical protein [Hahellaceae bacterium]
MPNKCFSSLSRKMPLSKIVAVSVAALGMTACGGGSSSGASIDQIVASSDSFVATYSAIGATQQGRSQFTLTIRDKSGNIVAGEDVTLMPMMAMLAGHNHSTPHEGCTTTNDQGETTCTVYYLMASSMNGEALGTWTLTATVDGETLELSPLVSMPMGSDTVRAVLKAQAGGMDMIPTMSMSMNMDQGDMAMNAAMDSMETTMEARSYYLFNDGLQTTDNGHSLSLFVAAKNSMTSYPAVATDAHLMNGETMVHVNGIEVAVSTDGAEWTVAEEQGSGHYIAADLQGLTAGTEATLMIKLTVNGEQKTTDGMALADANGTATFFVTP